jgi:hypothetical protein
MYQIALFIHICALLAATAASALVHLAQNRYRQSRTIAEARPWFALTGKSARVFPIAVITLLLTGAYMASIQWGFSPGWISGGLTGAFLLLANGALLGKRSARMGRQLAAASPNDPPPVDPVLTKLMNVPVGIALAVVFVMATKTSLIVSMAALVLGIIGGLLKPGAAPNTSATSTVSPA